VVLKMLNSCNSLEWCQRPKSFMLLQRWEPKYFYQIRMNL